MLKKIIAAVLVIGLAGCKSTTPEALIKKQCDQNRAAIEKTVGDIERREIMLAVIDDFEAQVQLIGQTSTTARNNYDRAVRDYAVSDDELIALQAEMQSCLDRLGQAARQHSLDLRKHCSEEEWRKITAHYHSLKHVVYF